MRQKTDFKHQHTFYFLLIVLLALSVFFLGLSVSRDKSNYHSSYYADYLDLQKEYQEIKSEYDDLQARNKELSTEIDRVYYKLLADGKTSELVDKLETSKLIAGLTNVRGEGLEISLDDKSNYDPLVDNVAGLVHDGTLRHLVDLLQANGAYAISINDERLVNNSYIFCVGTTILCNKERLAPPYLIRALGDPDKLAAGLDLDQEAQAYTEAPAFLRFSYKKVESIELPAYAGADKIGKDTDLLLISGQ